MERACLCLKKMAANTSADIASTSSTTIHSGTATNIAVADDVPLPSLPFFTGGKLEEVGSIVLALVLGEGVDVVKPSSSEPIMYISREKDCYKISDT